MNPQIRKGLLTHGLFVLAFVVVTLLVYLPSFTENKSLSQHDILQAYGANEQMKTYRETAGEEPLWNNAMFSGMPAYLSGVSYSGDILKHVYRFIRLGMPHPEGITFVGFISFYVLLLVLGVRPWIAFAGALAFGLNGFCIISITAGHNAKIAAASLAPLALAGILLTFRGRLWAGVGLTALALGLQIQTNHPQMTYYLLLITLIYGGFELAKAIKAGAIKPFMTKVSLLAVAAILAVGANAGRLMTIYEYSPYSIRGKSELKTDQEASSGLDKDYAFRYSNGIMEPLFLFIPNIFGGSSSQELSEKSATADALRAAGYDRMQLREQIKAMPTYWGDQPLTAPYYAGAVVFFLFVLGLVVLDKGDKMWLIVVVILGIVLSWGSNFSSINDLMFSYFPMYNKFRSVTFTIYMSLLAINMIGFLGLEKILSEGTSSEVIKKLGLALAISGGFALLLVIAGGLLGFKGAIDARLPEWLVDAIREDRASLLRNDALRALFFVASVSALIYFHFKAKISAKWLSLSIILLVFVDMMSLTKRFLTWDNFQKNPVSSYFRPTEADQVIMQHTGPGDRVLNLQNPFNEARTSYFHESIGGYHGAKLRRYQDVISAHIEGELSGLIGNLQAGSRDFGGLPVINMLNTRYFVAGPGKNAVLENPNALGNGWVVNSVVEVQSADEEINMLGTINPATTAVVDISKFDIGELPASTRGQIELLSKKPNELIYKASMNGDGLAVFSEIYYPKGWKAYVDGEETEILRADYILRALKLTSGKHEIKFTFAPSSYTTGNLIMLICSGLTVLLFLGTMGFTIRQQLT